MNAPAKKSAQLIDELNALAFSKPINELALARIRKEAEALLRSDKGAAFMVLGAISSIRGDEKEMHRHHGAAIEQAGDTALAYFNYANSLGWMENYSGAFEMAGKAYELGHDPCALDIMLCSAFALGLRGLVRELLGEWRQITGQAHKLENVENMGDYQGDVRESVLDLLEQDMQAHSELWKNLSRV